MRQVSSCTPVSLQTAETYRWASRLCRESQQVGQEVCGVDTAADIDETEKADGHSNSLDTVNLAFCARKRR